MSQMGQKADIALGPRHVRFTPESGHHLARCACPLCAKAASFDHLVGARYHCLGKSYIKGLCSFAIDDKFIFRWRLNWKVCWLCSFKNAVYIARRLPIQPNRIRAVRNEATIGRCPNKDFEAPL